MHEEMTLYHNPWNVLQQPYHPSSGIHPALRSLLAAIDQGWKIEKPAQILQSTPASGSSYRFTLTHPSRNQECQILVPLSPEVQQALERINGPINVSTIL